MPWAWKPAPTNGATRCSQHLTAIFRRYGLPRKMLMDNGPPWGAEGQADYTGLTVWLLRLGIRVSHSLS